MRAITNGAAKEIEALGIGIMPSDLAICLILAFFVLMIGFFISNRKR